MLRLLLLTTFVAFVVGDEYTDKLNEKMSGNWVPVKIFPPVPIKKNPICYAANNTVLDDYCKCGEKLVPQLKRANSALSNQMPIIVVETDEELSQGETAKCLCKDNDETSETFGTFTPFPTHMMIRIINDNYFVGYDRGYGIETGIIGVLLAKEVPTTAELNEFISKIDYLKDVPGTVVCTKTSTTTAKPRTTLSIDQWLAIRKDPSPHIMRIPRIPR